MKILITFVYLLWTNSLLAKQDLVLTRADTMTNNGSDITLSNIIPLGKSVKLTRFGCADPDVKDSITMLQWGDDVGGWTTIRACAGCFEFNDINRDFVGDGVKKFRVTRSNKANKNKEVVFWFEALVRD